MSGDTNTSFSAAPSAVGYLYQIRYALLESLRRLRKTSDFTVSLETLDDVVFDATGEPLDLIQTKHHMSRSANLTDASPDLWKSLRIWCERLTERQVAPNSTFYLVSTSTAPDGSAAHYLKAEDGIRNTQYALDRLNSVLGSSSNAENAPAYQAFRSLSNSNRETLLNAIVVIDAAPSIVNVDSELRALLFYAVERAFMDSFLNRLEGWWYRRSVQHLAQTNRVPIMAEELDAQTSNLREQFKQENLPIDDDLLAASVDASGYHDRVFVHQLRLIEVSNKRILHAIRNYFRAFEQRSRWIREDLLLVGELDRYEEQLVEEWDICFEQMKDELGDAAAEDCKKTAAHTLYKWVETGSHRPIRTNCTEPFVSRGSYHILSDQLRVGWHAEFVERLRHLLEPQEAVS